MDVDFVIPLSKADVLSGEAGLCCGRSSVSASSSKPTSRETYRVCFDFLIVRILFILVVCSTDLRSGGPAVILENFDCFFSLLRSVTLGLFSLKPQP